MLTNVGVERELGVEAVADGLEDRANLATQNGQDADNNNSDKNKDQCVLDQALAFLTSEEVAKHVCHPFHRVVVERVRIIAELERDANSLTVLLRAQPGHLFENSITPTLV